MTKNELFLVILSTFDYLFGCPFGCAPPFAILLRQGYEGTSYGGQAGLRLIKGKLCRMNPNLK